MVSWSSLVSFWLGLLLGLGVFGEFWWGVRVVLFVLAGLCLLLVGKICRSLRTIPGSCDCLDVAWRAVTYCPCSSSMCHHLVSRAEGASEVRFRGKIPSIN